MSRTARALVASATFACSACAALPAPSDEASATSGPLDVDRWCVSARWYESAKGTAIAVSVDNRCARPLTCDVHLGFTTPSGPELYLDCLDQHVQAGRTAELCNWVAQPVTPGGSGSMRCR